MFSKRDILMKHRWNPQVKAFYPEFPNHAPILFPSLSNAFLFCFCYKRDVLPKDPKEPIKCSAPQKLE